MFQEVSELLKKEITIELRQKYAVNGILLYLASTVFICYLSFNLQSNQLHPITWNALFWIVILFTAISAVAKSFLPPQLAETGLRSQPNNFSANFERSLHVAHHWESYSATVMEKV